MATPIGNLFGSTFNDGTQFNDGTHDWNAKVFEKAYGYPDGPFERVIKRVKDGFSVLVYLPGNCTRAAAAMLKKETGGTWEERGLLSERTQTITGVWQAYTGLFGALDRWIKGTDAAFPRVIFHNLDMLSDTHGGLDGSSDAKNALFYLTECSRSGVVLGLSDVSAGPLPEPIRRTFAEEVWLDEIPAARFPYLVPVSLGIRLAHEGSLPDSTAYLLASRLRWIDPIRAVRIMNSIANATNIQDALRRVVSHTKSIEFVDPSSFGVPSEVARENPPSGSDEQTTDLLEQSVIAPFVGWTNYIGDEPAVQLRKLPSGVILHGPPGTGKTELARWLAMSIGIPFRQVSAADLKRADYGLTERLVRDLFRSARRAAPCMIILDDADDLLPDRAKATGGVASAERGVVNAFLQEMEGFGPRLEGVLVILTTNRLKHLDRAAKSRLTLKIRVPYPLDTEQITALVLQIGKRYGIDETFWNKKTPLLTHLVEFFYRPMVSMSDVEDREGRRGKNKNLFSPRDISDSLRMILAKGDNPGPEILKGLKDYYDNLIKDEAEEG